jgi:hypothetical protein
VFFLIDQLIQAQNPQIAETAKVKKSLLDTPMIKVPKQETAKITANSVRKM